MEISKFYLRSVDILLLFVFGFTFLITAIDVNMGFAYFSFLILGSFYIMISNHIKENKK